MAKLYPIDIDIKIHITDENSSGSITYGFPMNKLPTEDDMQKVIKEAMSAAPDGFRLMTRQESMMYFLREKRGYRGPGMIPPAVADGDEWHDPETANKILFDDSYEDFDDAE